MSVIVDCYPTDRPNDVAGLERFLGNLPLDQIERLALLGKTEGTATINDFSRELAVGAAETTIIKFGGVELLSRSTLIFSTGCEGIISPSVYVLATLKDEEISAGGSLQLAMGGAQTRIMVAEELATDIQVGLVATAVELALKEASLRPDQASLVLVKSPILTPNEAALTADPAVIARAGISGLSRGAAALGVAVALGDLEIETLEDINIGKDFHQYATRAMTFSGTEVKHCEILVLGNRQGANGTSRIYSRQLNDILDTRSLKALFCEAGCNLDEIGELAGKEILQAVMLKVGIAPDGHVRGERTTVYQSEVDADKHMRASASGVIGSLLGTGRIFVSGGTEHQAPPGGGICACIVGTKAQ